MRAVLRKHCHDPSIYWTNRVLAKLGIEVNYLARDYRKLRFRTHDRIETAECLLPDPVFDELYKFAFVRNPWDLLVSLYKFIRKNPGHKRHQLVCGLEFRDFIDFAVRKEIAHQKRLLANRNGELLVDFVGRFENIDSDTQLVLQRLQIPAQLPHLNRTHPSSYLEYYDRKTQNKVATFYADDIDAFEYQFESVRPLKLAV